MNSPMLNLIRQSSTLSLGEVLARTPGDVESTASDLATLANDGLVTFDYSVSDTPQVVPIEAKSVTPSDLQIYISSDDANSVYVTATALALKL